MCKVVESGKCVQRLTHIRPTVGFKTCLYQRKNGKKSHDAAVPPPKMGNGWHGDKRGFANCPPLLATEDEDGTFVTTIQLCIDTNWGCMRVVPEQYVGPSLTLTGLDKNVPFCVFVTFGIDTTTRLMDAASRSGKVMNRRSMLARRMDAASRSGKVMRSVHIAAVHSLAPSTTSLDLNQVMWERPTSLYPANKAGESWSPLRVCSDAVDTRGSLVVLSTPFNKSESFHFFYMLSYD